MSKLQVVSEFWEFIKYNKKFWLTPIVFVLVVVGFLLVLASSSALAPFIYSLLMTSVLGISAFYHDSAACLVVDGEIIAAAQEERFTRIKHDHRFPMNAARYCLKEWGGSAEQLTMLASMTSRC